MTSKGLLRLILQVALSMTIKLIEINKPSVFALIVVNDSSKEGTNK